MAPILSKVLPPPPRSHKEVAERAYRKARPILEGFLCIVRETLEHGHVVYSSTAEKLNHLSDKAVTTSMWILESFCCIDFKKFARGPEPKLSGSLPIFFCLSLLTMLYHAFVFVYMPAAGISVNSPTSIIFHAFVFLCLASFIQATRIDPGNIPSDCSWRTEGSPPEHCHECKQGSNEKRWCQKSKAYKPDRAHYCRVMQRAVLKMDHHCPWLGNTIGWANHKFFYLFLTYTCGACGLLGCSILQLLVQATLPALSSFLLIGAEGLTLLLTSILVPFFLFHTWLIARNMTTIEFCTKMSPQKKTTEETSAEGGGSRLRSQYDIGVYNNFCAVLGDNPLLWFLPVGGPTGDGLSFPLRADLEPVQPLRQRLSQGLATAMAALSKAGVGKDAAKAREPEGLDDPEQAHPAADERDAEPDEEAGCSKECAEDETWQEEDWEGLAADSDSKESSQTKTSVISRQDAMSFLGWSSAVEFVDDLRVGCITIEESFGFAATRIAGLCGEKTRGHKQGHSSRAIRSSFFDKAAPCGKRFARHVAGSTSSSESQSRGYNSGAEFFSDA